MRQPFNELKIRLILAVIQEDEFDFIIAVQRGKLNNHVFRKRKDVCFTAEDAGDIVLKKGIRDRDIMQHLRRFAKLIQLVLQIILIEREMPFTVTDFRTQKAFPLADAHQKKIVLPGTSFPQIRFHVDNTLLAFRNGDPVLIQDFLLRPAFFLKFLCNARKIFFIFFLSELLLLLFATFLIQPRDDGQQNGAH